MSTVPFTEEAVKSYLDNAITKWRIRKDNETDPDEVLIASCYVDAFQSVRMSLFGELLPK